MAWLTVRRAPVRTRSRGGGRRLVVVAGAALALVLPAAAPAVAGGLVLPPDAISIEGVLQVGRTVAVVTRGTWTPANVALTYSWTAGDEPLTADGDTLVIGPDLVDRLVTVTVTGSAPGLEPASLSAVADVHVAPGVLAAATPRIMGTARVGASLTVSPGTWDPAPVFSYTWAADGVDIGGATGPSHVLTPADLGKRITATVRGKLPGYEPVSTTSVPTAAVVPGLFTTAPRPTLSGAVRVGATVTAVPGTWSPTATLSYQWNVAGAPVAGATKASFVPRPGDLGSGLSVTVTAQRAGYAPTARTSVVTTVGAGVFAQATVPTLSGAVRVGSVVTAVPGTWSPSATLRYQWRLDGRTISGATASTYRPVVADLGRALSVTVTGSRSGYTSVTRTSAAKAIEAGMFSSAPTPTISGTAVVGTTLTVKPGTWSPSATLSYRWKRNGTSITGATGTTYALTNLDHGARITVTVTAKRTGYTATSRTSAATAVVLKPFTSSPPPTISGTVRVGSTLTASVPAWSPTAAYTYQWRRNGVAITGATAGRYTLGAADYGTVISVTVVGTRSTYVATRRTSAQTVAVAKPAPTLRSDGTFQVGTDIKAGTYVSSTGSELCYWERRSDASDSEAGIIANDFGPRQRIVTISSTDRYFYTEGCGSWTRMYALGTPRTSMGDGVFAVGVHIQPGLYQAPGTPDGCYWGRLSGFSDFYWQTVDNDLRWDGPIRVRIYSSDVGFESWDCGGWTRVSG